MKKILEWRTQSIPITIKRTPLVDEILEKMRQQSVRSTAAFDFYFLKGRLPEDYELNLQNEGAD